MAYQVGLGASENDLEVQGEIDFDFFDNDTSSNMGQSSKKKEIEKSTSFSFNEKCSANVEDSSDIVETVRRTTIETTIPSPENYTGNNCGTSPLPHIGESQAQPSDSLDEVLTKPSPDDMSSSPTASYSDLSSSFSSEDSFDDEEQTDSMTDVTPLPSHCNSPIVKFEVKNSSDSSVTLHEEVESDVTSKSSKQCQKKAGVKFSDHTENCFHTGDSVDANKLLKAIKTLEVTQSQNEIKNETPFLTCNIKCRKNVTFTNEDVRKIDFENQRLLKRIVIQQNRTKPHFSAVYSRPASSAINRQKQQRQIELDNLALLKRLESAKPSQELRRAKLLNEYDNRSTMSSRASMRPMSRLSSQISSCRSSARSCGRSLKMPTPTEAQVIKDKSNTSTLSTNQHKLSVNGTTALRNPQKF